MKHLSIILLAAAGVIFLPLYAGADAAGTFAAVLGDVDVTRPGEAPRPARVGDAVFMGDMVRSKTASRAEIKFIDDSILRLAEDSRIEINQYLVAPQESNIVLKLFRGKVRSVVITAGKSFGIGKRNRYEVRTPTAVIGVRGTDFFTYFLNGLSGAVFKEGSGYGYSLDRPDVIRIIHAGEAMLVTRADKPPEIKPITDAEIGAHEADTSADGEGEREPERKQETSGGERDFREAEGGARNSGETSETPLGRGEAVKDDSSGSSESGGRSRGRRGPSRVPEEDGNLSLTEIAGSKSKRLPRVRDNNDLIGTASVRDSEDLQDSKTTTTSTTTTTTTTSTTTTTTTTTSTTRTTTSTTTTTTTTTTTSTSTTTSTTTTTTTSTTRTTSTTTSTTTTTTTSTTTTTTTTTTTITTTTTSTSTTTTTPGNHDRPHDRTRSRASLRFPDGSRKTGSGWV